MKNFIQKLRNSNGLYKKQCKIICTVLIFALFGICVSAIREHLPEENSVENQTSAPTSPEKKSSTVKTEKSISTKDASDSGKGVKKADSAAEKNTQETTKAAEDTTTSKSPQKNNTTDAVSQKPVSSNTSSESAPSKNPAPAEPEKVWIPPVYTTVHHEAIYKTVQMVCCNYCGATFGSVGEFQVHKDENGG